MPRTPKPWPAKTVGTKNSAPLPLPHERDEATGQAGHLGDARMEQAKRDLDAGLVDTDLRATPGLDAARREQLVPTPATSPAKQAGKPRRP